MACDISAGRARQCKESLGGVSKVYIFNYQEDPFTVSAGEATAINVAITTVYEFDIVGDNSTLVEDMVSDRNTGTTVNTQTLTLTLQKIDAATSAELNLLAKGYPQAVVKDRNDVYHAVGITEGIDFTVNSATGSARTDLSGYTLTGVSLEDSLSPKLDSSTVTALLALV